jgi:16S rRNA (cytidine1402-2'-O)-methyltransferase
MNTFIKGLYIVSTPIGNLDDITIRAKNILEVSDIILCEDTRHSLKLLNHQKIKKKLISYHKFNEKKEIAKIINYLKDGKILSLISDAGTPVLSDPGNMLINECVKQKINIIPIPGPTSITTAMSVSGFEDKFLFYGFLPKTEKEIEKVILGLKEFDYSIIFFTPSLKINFYLKIFKKHFIEVI